MGIGEGRTNLEGRIIFFKYMIFFTNIVCWLLGCTIFGLAMWIRFEDDFSEWVVELKFYQYWTGIYFLMIAGGVVMVVSFFGCCGAVMESGCMLYTFSIMLFILFVAELGSTAYLLNNGIENSKLYPWLTDRLLELIHQYDTNPRARRILNILQEYVGCCGAFGSGDYDSVHKPIPDTCRDHVTGNEYSDGCGEVFSWYLEQKTGWIAGVTLFLCLFQIALFFMTCCLARSISRDRDQYDPVMTKS